MKHIFEKSAPRQQPCARFSHSLWVHLDTLLPHLPGVVSITIALLLFPLETLPVASIVTVGTGALVVVVCTVTTTYTCTIVTTTAILP